MTKPVVELMRTAWHSLAELGATLSADDWSAATECPGWSVKDNYSHIIGTERGLMGEQPPPLPDGTRDWIKNPIGQMNEAWVESGRAKSGPEVLAEFEQVTAARLERFAEMSEDDWQADTPGPTGIVPYEEFMSIRVMDSWVHEQDVRRAVDRPGHQSGPVAEFSTARFVPAMGFVVGKKAGAADGQSVAFDLSGEMARQIGVAVEGGRAQVSEGLPDDPTVTLRMDAETWWCLALGRRTGEQARSTGSVEIEGDEHLGNAVLDNLAFMI